VTLAKLATTFAATMPSTITLSSVTPVMCAASNPSERHLRRRARERVEVAYDDARVSGISVPVAVV